MLTVYISLYKRRASSALVLGSLLFFPCPKNSATLLELSGLGGRDLESRHGRTHHRPTGSCRGDAAPCEAGACFSLDLERVSVWVVSFLQIM